MDSFSQPKATTVGSDKRTVAVLYIEDDSADVDFARTALKDIGFDNFHVDVIEDGEAAIQYLQKSGPYQEASTPDLIWLDLNLPKIHGKDVLRTIKADPHLKMIPVVVFTTSKVQREIDEAYVLGASGYFAKPTGYHDYKETFRAICQYWTTCAGFPAKEA